MAKPSVENKHLCKHDYFAILASCSRFILLTKYATHRGMGAPLKNIKRIKLFLLFVHAVFETLISEISP